MKRRIHPLGVIMLTLLLTIGMPSCDGPHYAAFRGIQNVDFFDVAANSFIPQPASLTSDSMAILIEPQIDFFTQVSFEGTMDQAWAFSPPEPIMANEITDIRIMSDKDMYGIPAGQDLSDILSFNAWSGDQFSLSVFLDDYLLKGRTFSHAPILVFFNSKPIPDTYRFVIELEDNNGHVFTATTPTLTWQ